MQRNRFLESDGSVHVLKFGRHAGKGVNEVAEEDRKYLEWMLNEIDSLPDDVREVIEEAVS